MPLKKKPASDLNSEGAFRVKQVVSGPEPPINNVVSHLTATDGDALELMTRTSPDLARAAAIGLIYAEVFGIDFVRRQVTQLERLAVSSGGGGRQDLIDALKAGGALPAEYYNPERSYGEASTIREEVPEEDERWVRERPIASGWASASNASGKPVMAAWCTPI